MLFSENLVMALNSLRTNKMRTFLTMLGIIIGISAVITIFTVGNSLTLSVSDSMQSIGANDIFVQVTGRTDNDDDAEDDRSLSDQIDGLKFADRRTDVDLQDSDYMTDEMVAGLADYMGGTIKAINISNQAGSVSMKTTGLEENHEVSASLRGVSVGYFVTNSTDITAGSMFSEVDFNDHRRVALVEQAFVDDMYNGDAEAAIGQEIDITVDNTEYPVTIIGVYKSNAADSGMMMFSSGGSTVLMPLGTVNDLTGQQGGRYEVYQIVAAVGQTPADLTDQIEQYFRPYYRTNPNYHVTAVTYDSLLNMLYKLLNTITTAISIVAGIALVVGGIGVMNIMLVSVTERTREIGTRKALGARNSSIRAQFIVEAMIICLIGGAIGVILGIVLGVAASNYLGYPARPSIGGIILALGFSMGIGVFFGYFPANKAAKMNPIDALRYE